MLPVPAIMLINSANQRAVSSWWCSGRSILKQSMLRWSIRKQGSLLLMTPLNFCPSTSGILGPMSWHYMVDGLPLDCVGCSKLVAIWWANAMDAQKAYTHSSTDFSISMRWTISATGLLRLLAGGTFTTWEPLMRMFLFNGSLVSMPIIEAIAILFMKMMPLYFIFHVLPLLILSARFILFPRMTRAFRVTGRPTSPARASLCAWILPALSVTWPVMMR